MSAAAVPALSRIANDRETYRQFLLQSFAILAFMGMGLGACLTLVGNDVVLVLLGPKWVEAGTIFQFFAPGIGAVFLYGPWGWIPLSIGRAERYSRWGLVELVVTALLFLVALPWGVKGIAAAWSASYWILALPATWYAGRPIGFGVGQVLEVVWKYILAAVAAAAVCFLVTPRVHLLFVVAGTMGSMVRIAAVSAIFGALYLGIAILLHGGLEPVQQITRLLPDLAPRLKFFKPSSSPSAAPAGAPSAHKVVAAAAGTATIGHPNTREIAALAHQLWIERGCPEGSRETDWTRAERELQNKRS
jgi:PST family polysaccharide transporter